MKGSSGGLISGSIGTFVSKTEENRENTLARYPVSGRNLKAGPPEYQRRLTQCDVIKYSYCSNYCVTAERGHEKF